MSSFTESLLPRSAQESSASLDAQHGHTNHVGKNSQEENRHDSHNMSTYTAGEETSRLAAAAKEMGLERRREQRAQIRSFHVNKSFFVNGVLPILAETKDKSSAERKPNFLETLAGVAGNILEWYDFAVFGYFGDIIGEVFFPPGQKGNLATVESFAVFGLAFLMRPIGGLFLGYLGDVYGRKKALITSIFLMAFPTFAMGCLPSYKQIGYWSTILLVVIRCLQGMSVGGQLMSSLVFTLESVNEKQWGLYGSFVMATGELGALLGSLVGVAIRGSLSHDQLVAWGWRLPFLSGVVVSLAGFYLQSTEDNEDEVVPCDKDDDLCDTDESRADAAGEYEAPMQNSAKKKKRNQNNPLRVVFARQNIRPLLASALVPMLWSSGFYLSFVWMAVYMEDLIDKPVPGAFAVNSAALFLSVCLMLPVAGWLSDKFGRQTIMSIGGASLAVLGPILLRAIGRGNTWVAFISQMILGICLSFWGSPMCAWLVESFEPEARLTSVSIGYNVAHAIVGGGTPALATYLVDAVGPNSPGWIYTVFACVSVAGLWLVAPGIMKEVEAGAESGEETDESVLRRATEILL